MYIEAELESEPPVNIAITRDVHATLKEYCGKRGIVQRTAAGRIISWWAKQSPIVQRMVMGDPDADIEAAYRLIIKEFLETRPEKLLPADIRPERVFTKTDVAKVSEPSTPPQPPKPKRAH